ncbi:MAG TPA: glycosyltransferase family 39 protein [Thermoanaerobaculia bacterium]|nr:glycosyltransferase family 39 protein [Thermoanaerobaculia bacterium]
MAEERDDGMPWFVVASIALLVCAAVIRFHALAQSLFEDEVWVAQLMQRGGLRPHTYNTPPLFYAIGRLWFRLRGPSDIAMREPAAFFGVLLGAIPFLAPLPRLTRFTWSALLLFSSPFIFYSERLKQYTLEAAVGTLLIVLWLRAARDDRTAQWVLFFAVAICSVLTLHTPVFVVASLGAAALVTKKLRRLPLIAMFFGVGLVAAGAYVAYMAPGPETVKLHGDMTQWFTVTGRWTTSASSFVSNTTHWLGQAFNLTPLWWLFAAGLGLLWLAAKRDLPILAMAAVPPLIAVAGSIARVYPYGEVRLMLMCFPALYLLIADAIAATARRVPLALLVVVPFMFRGDAYNRTYMKISDLRTMYETVVRGDGAVYASLSYAAPLSYYYPQLGPRLRVITATAPSQPGWYVQRNESFDASRASVVIREGNTVAARIP